MIRWLLFFMLVPFFLVSEEILPWIVYYGDTESVELFEPYNPIVFDGFHHPPLQDLLQKKKEILGYLDLTEVSKEDSSFSLIQKKGKFIQENKDWKGSFSIDIRQKFWKKHVIKDIIPKIVAQGFTGLFLDQIDVAVELEKQDQQKYKGMTLAAIDLVKTIKKKFPTLRLMVNRGYEILPSIADQIDYVLAETLYSIYDFETKTYRVRSKEEFAWALALLRDARKKFPHLVLFSLDYWDPSDEIMVKKIYSIERSHCLRPYVSTPFLNRVFPEPL